MRHGKAWLILTLALVTGAIAGYLVLDFMRSRVAGDVIAAPESIPVIVASRDLPAGTVIAPVDLKTVQWPTASVSPSYARSAQELVGRGLVVDVSADEPILDSKLAAREAGGGLSVVIPEGMRAMSVKVDDVIGVAGFVLPGTRVDVLVTLNPTNDREKATSMVVLQDVEAVAAGQMTQRDAEGKPQDVPVVTLLVTPEQAEKLTLASTEGRIQLALRNIMDRELVETKGARAATLLIPFGASTEPARTRPVRRAAPRPDPGQTVVTYDGAERKVTTF